jgi:hypothetical protein
VPSPLSRITASRTAIPSLRAAEIERVKRKRPENLDAARCYTMGSAPVLIRRPIPHPLALRDRPQFWANEAERALEWGERAVRPHQPRVAHDIGYQYRRQPALYPLPAHLLAGPERKAVNLWPMGMEASFAEAMRPTEETVRTS